MARDRLRADGPFPTPATWLVAMHVGAIVLPIAAYFYLVHPAWSWMYTRDPSSTSALWLPLLVLGHGALVFGGWYGASLLLRRDLKKPLVAAAAVLATLALVVLLACRHRLATASDYLGFRAGQGTGLFKVALGWAVMIAVLAIVGSAGYVGFELMRDGRRVRTR